MSLITKKSAPMGLVTGCIIFGLGSVIVAKIPVGAYAMAFWRLGVAAIIFWLLARFFQQVFPSHRLAKRYALLAGVFLGFDLALWHESIYAVGPGISTLLNSLQIFWLSSIGIIWFKERLSIIQIIGLIIAIIGVALIGSPEFHHNQQAFWGFITGIVSGLMLALSMVCVRKVHQTIHVPIFPLMLYISFGGMLALLLPMLVFNHNSLLPQTLGQIGWILVYGAVMQCLAWGLIAYTIPLISLSMTGLLLLSEPIAAVVIDYLFLDKPISAWQWLGVIFTLGAIYLNSVQSKKVSGSHE